MAKPTSPPRPATSRKVGLLSAGCLCSTLNSPNTYMSASTQGRLSRLL